MSISQTATKKDKKHGIQRRFQDALGYNCEIVFNAPSLSSQSSSLQP
jgi:hypothetical protein